MFGILFCYHLNFEKVRKTAKNEENPRKSRVFRPASFKTGTLGGVARNRTGGTLFQGGFQRVFLLRKPPFFRFSQKNIVKYLCLGKEVLRIAYIYKKEDCDAATACINPKENANCSGAVAIRTKYARGPPLPQT